MKKNGLKKLGLDTHTLKQLTVRHLDDVVGATWLPWPILTIGCEGTFTKQKSGCGC